jgi:primosomal protein N' (replication factor Y)
MFVIEVIPLVRGIQIESLSYFSSTSYSAGTIVTIPVRGKTISGIVVDSNVVSSTKTALKAATFSLRKLPEQKNITAISSHLLATVAKIYEIVPAKKGSILFNLLPPDVRSGLAQYPNSTSSFVGNEDSTPQILAGTTQERILSYQTVIRSAFAHRGSVMLVVPTSTTVQKMFDALSQGIKERVVCFSSHQTKKERAAAYAAFSDLSQATLTITTPSFAYLDRSDSTTIVVEQAASSHYIMRTRPNLDHREVLKMLARVSGRALILGDTLTLTEDEYRRREDIYQTAGEHPIRLELPAKLTIISQTDKPQNDIPFQLFSPDLIKRIQTSLEGRHNVFLFAARRGLAPVVACIDCGHIFRCPDSGTPYSLLRTVNSEHVEERWFLSSTSGKRVRAADICTDCGSWRLRERGIGIQQVEDECKKLFPNTPLSIFDHTTATTHKRAIAVTKDFEKQKGAILLGTQMIMPYMPNNIAMSAIVSLDAVRAIPSWRADETVFRLILELREVSHKEVIIQTRSETDDVLVYAGRGAVDRFHDDEIALRKMLKYPPFAKFIFLSWQGQGQIITDTEDLIKKMLASHNISGNYYTNPNSHGKTILRHCLLRLPPDFDTKPLTETLRHLPPYIAITINPERIV